MAQDTPPCFRTNGWASGWSPSLRPVGGRRRLASDRARARPRPRGARARRRGRRRSRRGRAPRLPSSTGPSTVTALDAAQRVARGTDRDRGAAELRHATERRPAQHPATGAFGLGHDERLTAARGHDHLVLGQPRLERAAHPSPPAARAGGPHGRAATAPAPPRGPAGRGAPGRARGTRPGPPGGRAGMRWKTASVPIRTSASGTTSVVGVDRGDRRPREQRREVVAHARHTRVGRRGSGCRGSAGRSAVGPCRSAST